MNNSFDLDGRIAIVTGGTGGIGKGIARRLAEAGARVVICARDADRGAAVARELDPSGTAISFFPGNVMVWEDMVRLADHVIARHGQIDICVVSGGGSYYPRDDDGMAALGLFHQNVPADMVKVISDAALSKITPARAVVDHMIARGTGNILFITSEGGRVPTPRQTAISYQAGGLIAMTKVAAKELARHHVRVNTIAVSIIEDTPSWNLAFGGESAGSSVYDKIRAKAPFGLATPANIADVAAFLVSDGAAFMTGAILSPTGGLTLS